MARSRDWDIEYDGAAPKLPKLMTRISKEWIKKIPRYLPAGAYFLKLVPRVAQAADVELPNILAGVLRIHHQIGKRLVSSGSGDLYLCGAAAADGIDVRLREAGDQETRLRALQLPQRDYRFYLRLETLWVTGRDQLVLGFDSYRYVDPESGWQRRQAIMMRVDRPTDEYLRSELPIDYGEHKLYNGIGTDIGTMRMVRISDLTLRHAEIQFHRLKGLEMPKIDDTGRIDDSTSDRFRRSLGSSRWTVDLPPRVPIDKPEENRPWTRHRLRVYDRDNIEAPREDAAEDHEPWVYNLLVVDHIKARDSDHGPLGLMFDHGRRSGNQLPRQAAAVAAAERIAGSGETLQQNPRLFHWTALHELGHMQGLYHNPEERGLMQPRAYRKGALREKDLKHSEIDALRLMHLPDLWVRPGTVPFLYRYRATAVDVLDLINETEELEIAIERQTIQAGKSPGELVVRLKNKNDSQIVFLCPTRRSVQPQAGRVGVALEMAAGDRLEVYPIHFPRTLGGTTELWAGESIEYRIAWQDPPPVIDSSGIHRVHVHLLWIAVYTQESGRGKALHHASGTGEIRVVSTGDKEKGKEQDHV